MQQNCKTYKLSELTSVITKGTTPSTYGFDFEKSGINYIRAQSLNYDGIIDTDVFSYINEEAHKKLKRSQLQKGDILFSMAGYLGMTGMVKETHLPANTNQAVCIIRIQSKNVDKKFVEYLLRNPSTISFVNSQSGQTAQPNINLTEIGNLAFKFPELKLQTAIASILSSLDDKIELNLQMNKTLEEMAMALYKHWFVDFGPFKDGEFVESEIGMIPKGWEVKRLGEITENISKGTTPSKKDLDGLENTIPFIKVKDLSSDGFINESNLELIPNEVHNKQLKRSILFHKDILFSIAGTIGKVALVPETLTNSNCNQALAFIRLNNQNELLTQVYYFLNHENTQEKINSSIVQGVQANVSLTVIKDLKMVIGDKETYYSFNLKIKPIFDLIQKNKIENRVLTLQRDSLLPKLISGEITLKK